MRCIDQDLTVALLEDDRSSLRVYVTKRDKGIRGSNTQSLPSQLELSHLSVAVAAIGSCICETLSPSRPTATNSQWTQVRYVAWLGGPNQLIIIPNRHSG